LGGCKLSAFWFWWSGSWWLINDLFVHIKWYDLGLLMGYLLFKYYFLSVIIYQIFKEYLLFLVVEWINLIYLSLNHRLILLLYLYYKNKCCFVCSLEIFKTIITIFLYSLVIPYFNRPDSLLCYHSLNFPVTIRNVSLPQFQHVLPAYGKRLSIFYYLNTYSINL